MWTFLLGYVRVGHRKMGDQKASRKGEFRPLKSRNLTIDFLGFLTIFHSLNEFSSIYRQIKKFELQVCYSLARKLCKIIITYYIIIVHICNEKSRKIHRKL